MIFSLLRPSWRSKGVFISWPTFISLVIISHWLLPFLPITYHSSIPSIMSHSRRYTWPAGVFPTVMTSWRPGRRLLQVCWVSLAGDALWSLGLIAVGGVTGALLSSSSTLLGRVGPAATARVRAAVGAVVGRRVGESEEGAQHVVQWSWTPSRLLSAETCFTVYLESVRNSFFLVRYYFVVRGIHSTRIWHLFLIFFLLFFNYSHKHMR